MQPSWLAEASLPQLLHALKHAPCPYLPLGVVGFSHLNPIMAVDGAQAFIPTAPWASEGDSLHDHQGQHILPSFNCCRLPSILSPCPCRCNGLPTNLSGDDS